MKSSISDRRKEVRVDLCVPLTFRPLADGNAQMQEAESINLSQRGVCISTAYPLNVGAEVELLISMPQEVTGKPASQVRCTARVVHVRANGHSGKATVGLRVERYDAMAATRERWAS